MTTLTYDQLGRLERQVMTAAGETTPTLIAANTYDEQIETGSDNIGLLTTAANDNAVYTDSLAYTGTGSVVKTQATIDGITHETVETRGRQGKPASVAYTPAPVDVGSASQPYVYNAADLLASIPGQIAATSYEADGQTKSIAYGETLSAEHIVVAAGIHSGRLLQRLGVRIPMESERGYHVTVTSGETPFEIPVMPSTGRMANTPTDMGLRLSGTGRACYGRKTAKLGTGRGAATPRAGKLPLPFRRQGARSPALDGPSPLHPRRLARDRPPVALSPPHCRIRPRAHRHCRRPKRRIWCSMRWKTVSATTRRPSYRTASGNSRFTLFSAHMEDITINERRPPAIWAAPIPARQVELNRATRGLHSHCRGGLA
ncbi:hypothetical protein ACVJBD_006219 [Rhizobium mongolense]